MVNESNEYYAFEGSLRLKGLTKQEAEKVTLNAAALDPDLFMEWCDENAQYMSRHALAQLCIIYGRSGAT